MTSDAIIVGGGVGGLVAARRLALAGWAVTVFERSQRLGGQVARQRIAGVDLDAGAESFATRGGDVAALIGELGLTPDVVAPTTAPAWLFRADGKAAPLPATGVLGIPGNPLARDVVHAIGLRGAWRARLDGILPRGRGADASSLGDLVRSRMGAAVVDGLVAPVVRGVHSTDPDALALERAHPRLRDEVRARGSLAAAVRALRAAAPAGSQVAGIRNGMFRLVDALADDCRGLGVAFELGVAAEEVRPDGVLAGDRRRRGLAIRACADPARGPAEDRRVTLVTLVVEAPALDSAPRGAGVLVAAEARGVRARALTHLTAKWEWVAEAMPGRHAVRLSYDGAPDDPIATATTDAGILLGAPIIRVIDATSREWVRAAATAAGPVPAVGESAAGTGLASVVSHAERTVRALVESSRIRPSPEAGARMEE